MTTINERQSHRWKAPLLFLGGVLLAGAFGVYHVYDMKASNVYNKVTSTSNRHYDAQVVNQVGKGGYALYTAGPYYTSKATQTRDANGSLYKNDYVRVMQTKTTKTGTYVKLRYYSKTLGWMNVHGIKAVSFSQVAKGTMAQYGFVGSAALISAGEKTPTVVNTGYANKAKGLANSSTGNVLYPLASLQKAMTGAIIQQLISAGKLSANTPLSKYYPQVKNSSHITIKQMLSMTSGISDVEQHPKTDPTESQAIALAIKTLKVGNSTSFNYSDDNFVLLAGIISKVTGQSYSSNVTSRILKPTGMTHTFIVNQTVPTLTGTVATSYTLSGKTQYTKPQMINYPTISAIPGAGNILTTPTDYMAFILGLQNGKVLSQAQYHQLLSYGSTYSGGFYVTRSGVKFNNGSFDGFGYHTGYYATTGNYHSAVVFSNQTPVKDGVAQKAFADQLYQVATYY